MIVTFEGFTSNYIVLSRIFILSDLRVFLGGKCAWANFYAFCMSACHMVFSFRYLKPYKLQELHEKVSGYPKQLNKGLI